MSQFLTIGKCPHDNWMISVDDDNHHGVRLTPRQCCRQWHEVVRFQMSARDLREAAEQLSNAAAELDGEMEDPQE